MSELQRQEQIQHSLNKTIRVLFTPFASPIQTEQLLEVLNNTQRKVKFRASKHFPLVIASQHIRAKQFVRKVDASGVEVALIYTLNPNNSTN